MLNRLAETSAALGIIIASSLVTSLYIEYFGKRIIIENLQKTMQNPEVKAKFKAVSEKTIRRVFYDPHHRRAITYLASSVIKSKVIESNTKDLFLRTFEKNFVSEITYSASKKFMQVLVARWLSSEDFEKDW